MRFWLDCSRPLNYAGRVLPCQRCQGCRINHADLWALRIELEAANPLYAEGSLCSFLTLTYDDAHLPEGGLFRPRDLTLYLKRLRKNSNQSFRYFWTAEKGDAFGRQHYHAVIFGLPFDHPELCESWGLGFVQAGPLVNGGAKYVSSYALKGAINEPDQERPYLARMSTRPPLGAWYVDQRASEIVAAGQAALWLDTCLYNPVPMRWHNRQVVLGRTLTRRFLSALGADESYLSRRATVGMLRRQADADVLGVPELLKRESNRAVNGGYRAAWESSFRRLKRSL